MLFFSTKLIQNLSKKITLVYRDFVWWYISATTCQDNYVDLSDLYVVLSDPYYVDFSDPYVDLSAFYVDL